MVTTRGPRSVGHICFRRAYLYPGAQGAGGGSWSWHEGVRLTDFVKGLPGTSVKQTVTHLVGLEGNEDEGARVVVLGLLELLWEQV